MKATSDIDSIVNEYRNLSAKLIGRLDIHSEHKLILTALKPAILGDHERGLSLKAICANIRAAVPSIESNRFVREVIGEWIGLGKQRRRCRRAAIKTAISQEVSHE